MTKRPLLLLFIMALMVQSGLSQDAHFPLQNARWCYAGYSDQGQSLGTDCFSPDTILTINGLDYARITYYDHPYAQPNTLFYREAQGQFFVWPIDSSEEILIYDFNLTVGDSFLIQWAWAWGEPEYIVVQQVDSITTLDGVVRKMLFLSNGSRYGTWMEGIGEANSVFCQPAYFASVSGGYTFECFSRNSALVYPVGGIDVNCPNVSTSSPVSSSTTVQLYPNPVAEQLTVEVGSGKLLSVNILDGQGKLVLTKKTILNEITIPVPERIPTGVYFVQVMIDSGVVVRKMLKE